jgi:acyl-coenzyme A synthetase/AMP-(fatty) acid ligase
MSSRADHCPRPVATATLGAERHATPMNAAAILLGNGSPQHPALVGGGECVTYNALRDAVARAASVWRQRGVAPGDRVAIKLPDGSVWVSAFLGTMWAGGVAVAVNPRIPADEWQFILGDAGFRFILAESHDDAPAAYRERVVTVTEFLRDALGAAPIGTRSMDAEAPAFWTHSSGSSGRPKAVVHAHRFALHVERVAAELLDVGAGDRLFASSKLFFSYPLGNSLFSGLKLGATVILDPGWPTAAGVMETIEAERPTVLFSVPSLYRNLLKEGLACRIAECGVERCVSAGEALPRSVRDEWLRQTGVAIVDGYGASETLSLVLINLGHGHDLVPAPGVEIRSLSRDHQSAPTRLAIKAPTLALGYWNRPDADAEYFRDGTFCPADLFDCAGGVYRFAGREDSLVKIHGRWVNLSELEQRLANACPAIVEAAAASVPDGDGVDAVAFFYVVKAGAPADAESLLRAHVNTLPHYRRPRWLHAVASLPRTATGKLLRRDLKLLHRTLALQTSGAEGGEA